jgi:uncharacterized protein
MKIPIDDIPQSPKEIIFSERIEDLNNLYAKEPAADFRFPSQLGVKLIFYRAEDQLFFHGQFDNPVTARCSRCLEEYVLPLKRQFDLVLVPAPAKVGRGAEEIRNDELGVSFYSGDEIDMAPLIGEQVLLALPTRPLCGDACRGLCARCGANLNEESCRCTAASDDPRMAIFRTLKVGR